MVIFHSYVCLPEGNTCQHLQWDADSERLQGSGVRSLTGQLHSSHGGSKRTTSNLVPKPRSLHPRISQQSSFGVPWMVKKCGKKCVKNTPHWAALAGKIESPAGFSKRGAVCSRHKALRLQSMKLQNGWVPKFQRCQIPNLIRSMKNIEKLHHLSPWKPPFLPYRGASSRTSGTSQGRRAWPGYHPDGMATAEPHLRETSPGKKRGKNLEKPWKTMGEASPDVFFLPTRRFFDVFFQFCGPIMVGPSKNHPIHWPSVWWDVESWDIPSNGFGNPNLGWSFASIETLGASEGARKKVTWVDIGGLTSNNP